jgi:hypothetical protein
MGLFQLPFICKHSYHYSLFKSTILWIFLSLTYAGRSGSLWPSGKITRPKNAPFAPHSTIRRYDPPVDLGICYQQVPSIKISLFVEAETCRQGPRRPPVWPSRPLQLSLSPLSPPEGEFPPATPSGGRQASRQAIPLLQPCHAACIFPFRAQARASPALSSAPGPAPPLLILARCFLLRDLRGRR